MLPFIEQGAALQRVQRVDRHGRASKGLAAASSSTARSIRPRSPRSSARAITSNLASRPIAATGGFPASPGQATKGNYGVNWGNTGLRPGPLSAASFTPHRCYRCSLRSASAEPERARQLVRIASVTDGTSNTQFVSELLQGASRRHPRHDLGRQSRRRHLHDAVHAQRIHGLRRLIPPWSTVCGVQHPRTTWTTVASFGGSSAGHQSRRSRLVVRQPARPAAGLQQPG